jgi:hexokinase
MNEHEHIDTAGYDALNELRDEAEAAANSPDLQERVRQLTHRALLDRKLSFTELREIVASITEGLGRGLNARGGEIRDELRRAVSGLDDAIGSTAEAISLTVREAAARGREVSEGELKDSLARVRELESALRDGIKQTARLSSGKLREEFTHLGEHLKTTGADTGARVRDAVESITNSLRASGHAGRSGVREAVEEAGIRASSVASGVLSALSDALKRQSDRLHR